MTLFFWMDLKKKTTMLSISNKSNATEEQNFRNSSKNFASSKLYPSNKEHVLHIMHTVRCTDFKIMTIK
jgi:hypothetical protein